jgi:hypothetical protein
MCEVAADGVLHSEATGHTSNFFVLKCKDLPPDMESRDENIHPLLIVPNEKAPVTVFTVMILMLFVVMSPKSGVFRPGLNFCTKSQFISSFETELLRRLLPPALCLVAVMSLPQIRVAGNSEKMVNLRTVTYPERRDGVVLMKSREIQPILTSLVCDFVMRSKLTLWKGQTGKVNGGWCMCVMKQEYEGPKVHNLPLAVLVCGHDYFW